MSESITDYSMLSDEQLADGGISADSSERVAELLSRYNNLVFAMARKYSDNADYEELVSDGLDALLNAISHYDAQRGSFAGFAAVCISNRMKNTADRAMRRAARLAEESELDAIKDTSPSPEELVLIKESTDEMSTRMKDLLTPLEHRCLDGVILGRSYTDIAERLGIDRKAVDNAVSRARAKLKAVFPDY